MPLKPKNVIPHYPTNWYTPADHDYWIAGRLWTKSETQPEYEEYDEGIDYDYIAGELSLNHPF